ILPVGEILGPPMPPAAQPASVAPAIRAKSIPLRNLICFPPAIVSYFGTAGTRSWPRSGVSNERLDSFGERTAPGQRSAHRADRVATLPFPFRILSHAGPREAPSNRLLKWKLPASEMA